MRCLPNIDSIIPGQIQDLGSALIELWSLLDTSTVDKKRFDHVTCLISSSVDEVSSQGSLSLDVIERVCSLSVPVYGCFLDLAYSYLSVEHPE